MKSNTQQKSNQQEKKLETHIDSIQQELENFRSNKQKEQQYKYEHDAQEEEEQNKK